MIIIGARDLVREVRKALPGEVILERREGQIRINMAKKRERNIFQAEEIAGAKGMCLERKMASVRN